MAVEAGLTGEPGCEELPTDSAFVQFQFRFHYSLQLMFVLLIYRNSYYYTDEVEVRGGSPQQFGASRKPAVACRLR